MNAPLSEAFKKPLNPYSAGWPPTAWLCCGLLLLCGILFFYHLGHYPLFDVDEPRYAEAGREMLESGNWLMPYFNYTVRFDKPVFFYWLVAGMYKVFGVSEWSARLWSALSGTITVLTTFLLGKAVVSKRFGLYAACILATSIQIIGLSRVSITDMTLAMLMTLTAYSLFLVGFRSARWWLVAGIFAGMAVLTKGPVGIVLPGATLVLYSLLTRQFKACFLNRWFVLGVLLFVGVALPWYVLAYQAYGQAFIDALFLHNVKRFEGVVSGHDQPVWFFIPVVLIGALPWSMALPALFYAGWANKGILKDTFSQEPPAKSPGATTQLLLFMTLWASLVFVFFTVAQTKLLTYILPLFPGLALLFAGLWDNFAEQKQEALAQQNTFQADYQTVRVLAWLLPVIALVAGGLFMMNMGQFLPREARELTTNPFNGLAVGILFLGTALTAFFVHARRITPAIITQTLTMALLSLVAVQWIIPSINQATQGAVLSFLQRAQGGTFMTYEIIRPSLTFYGRRKIEHLAQDDRAKLDTFLHQHPEAIFVMTKRSFVPAFKHLLAQTAPPDRQTPQLLDERSVYVLFKIPAQSAP